MQSNDDKQAAVKITPVAWDNNKSPETGTLPVVHRLKNTQGGR